MRLKTSQSLSFVILASLIVPVVLLILGVGHGLLQSLYRADVIHSDRAAGLNYYQGLTLHGVVNAIVLTTFFAVALGHALTAYSLKKEPGKAWLWTSFVLMIVGTLTAAAPILLGKASVLYTFYPPLMAHPAFYIGATLLVIGSWVAFFGWIPPYLSWKKENPALKTPLAVYGNMVNFTIWFLCTLPLAYEVLVQLIPWSLGLVQTVHVPLARTLFWFFGHPLVYFWLLPSYIAFYVMLPKLAGGKLYSDAAGRWAFLLFLVFSIPVGVHHQFTEPGFRDGVRLWHTILTMAVAIPSFLTAFTIAASLEYAGRQNGGKGLIGFWFRLPWVSAEKWLFGYLAAGLVIFFAGGVTGIINASYNLDLVVHNTSWIPGHFHLTVAGPVFLAILGLSLQMTATLRGREVALKGLNALVPWLWLLGLAFFSTGMMVNGVHGEPRRTNLGLSPYFAQHPEWHVWAKVSLVGGVIMTVAAVSWFAVFFSTLFGKPRQEAGLEFPVSEALHDEPKTAVTDRLTPWIVLALVLIAVSYVPAIQDALKDVKGVPGYTQDGAPVQSLR